MNLNEYFDAIPYGEKDKRKDEMAAFLGCHESLIRHYRNGTRHIPPQVALKLEKFDANLRKEDLLPEIFAAA